ncbi:MAG: LL-diaminopimelate aminotransferase [Planctomycetota bacterium]
MQVTRSERLAALPPYLFAEIDRQKRAALAAGRDIIDFGVGDPDKPTHGFIIERMEQAIRDPRNHVYPLGGGSAAFRQQIADFFQGRYGVALDPQREVLALIGSKEGIGHLPLAVVNPGETVIVPSPGYPVYRAGTIFAGGQPWTLPLTADTGWLPDLAAIPAEVARSAVLMFINYPNNPTGALADLAFYERVVRFAGEHNMLVAQDAAYNELYLGTVRPPSILQVAGAREVAIEFHSASKTFNMTGWRVGFAVGQADALAALAAVKANFDSGVFGAVQAAACTAYAGSARPELAAMRSLYRERAEALCAALRRLGFAATPPPATFYVWARVPAGYDSMTVCTRLLEEADIVCVPGSGFGPTGAGYVRFALSVPAERMERAVQRLATLRW